MNTNSPGRVRFGEYELEAAAGRLFRDGHPVKIQPQPLRVLKILADRSGEIVSRDYLRISIWGDATFVEFDQGLNYCVRQIRLALRDDASNPIYIETLPKQGYRFIGHVVAEATPPIVHEHMARTPADTIATARRRWRRQLAVPMLVLAASAWWTTAGRGTPPGRLRVTSVSHLTTYQGDEREPAMSPDGASVAFSWSGEKDDNYDIYVIQPGTQQPLRLTQDPAQDSFPAWSPDGRQIAFIRRTGIDADIILVPSLGGPERRLSRGRLSPEATSLNPALSWSRDGRWIVFAGQSEESNQFGLYLLSVETGAVRAVSLPENGYYGDGSPALSSSGSSVAFVRYVSPDNGQVLIQPLSAAMAPIGRAVAATPSGFGFGLNSPVWMGDGLLFADHQHIYQWTPGHDSVPIYAAEANLRGISVGPTGSDGVRHAVVWSDSRDDDIWALPLDAKGTTATEAAHLLQRSTATDFAPSISPTGRQIAFSSTRSGNMEIWVADADGQHPRQVTHLGAHIVAFPTWSPDATRIAFQANMPVSHIYVVDVNQGIPRQVTLDDQGLNFASWSSDGQFVYASSFTKTGSTIVRAPADGGPEERLWEGGWQRESLDGARLFYLKRNEPGIYSRSLKGDLARNPEELMVPGYEMSTNRGGYAPVRGGIYYVASNALGQVGPFRFFDESTRTSIDVAAPVRGLGPGFSAAPDKRSLVYTARARDGGNLLLLELRP